MENEDELTLEEQEQLEELMKSYNSPTPDEKHTVHSFLHKVATSKDTLKTGNLTQEEVGNVRLPVRSVKEFELMAKELCKDDMMKRYFAEEAEIITASSLSKDGFLVRQSTLQRKELSDNRQPRKQNKGWFRSKESNQLSDYQVQD